MSADHITALMQKAIQHHQAGALDAAEKRYRDVLSLESEHAGALGLLGAIALQRGQLDEALKLLTESLQRDPQQPVVLSNRGFALSQLHRPQEALTDLDQAVVLAPTFPDAHNNRGNALWALKRHEAALESFDRAIALNPVFAEAFNNRGNTLYDMGRLDDALLAYTEAIHHRPSFALAYFNRAKTLTDLGRFDDADADYDRAITLAPQDADARFGQGMLKLLKGDFANGWPLYESRWASRHHTEKPRHFRQPQWDGQSSLQGKTILVHAEQGFGDTLQFIRFIPSLQALGANVILIIQPELKTLLAPSLKGCIVLASADHLPAFDVHCPLLSLPAAFKTTLETIPAAIPYIFASDTQMTLWQQRLGTKTHRRIGLAWSGRPTHRNDKNRSISPDHLSALFGTDHEFHVLQNHISEGHGALLQSYASVFRYDRDLTDFSETAGLVAQMDLVITVDTSIAHLAGAMGKPVWILLPFVPDFRWLLERSDSPWYPTARLFRQQRRGDWNGVIMHVKKELTAL